jgi:hypothetical protein
MYPSELSASAFSGSSAMICLKVASASPYFRSRSKVDASDSFSAGSFGNFATAA